MQTGYLLLILLILFILLILISIYLYYYVINKPTNNTCTSTSDCPQGEICLSNICINNNTNNNFYTIDIPIDGKCSIQNCLNIGCSTNNSYCNASAVCVCGTGKTINQQCNTDNDCLVDLYCASNNTCQQSSSNIPVPTGGTCNVNNDCVRNDYCAYNKTCTPGNVISYNITNNNTGLIFSTTISNINYTLTFDENSETLGLVPTGQIANFTYIQINSTTLELSAIIPDGFNQNSYQLGVIEGGLLVGGIRWIINKFYVFGPPSGNGSGYISDQLNNNLRYNPNNLLQVGFYDKETYNSPDDMINWPYINFNVSIQNIPVG